MSDINRVLEKPPIGAKPYKISAVERINELLAAIGRYANNAAFTDVNISRMHLWITELEEQIDLIGTMMIYDDDKSEVSS